MKLTIGFYECEHDGDLSNYADDVRKAGGAVLKRQLNEDEEAGYLLVEVADKAAFIAEFRKTESYQFSSLAN